MRGFCPDSEWFARFAERRLSESDEVWLRRHASRCDDCRRELALTTSQVGREAPDTVPADVNARLRANLLKAVERRNSTRRIRTQRSGEGVRYAIFAAAVLVAVLGLTLVLMQQGDRNPHITPKIVDHDKPTPIVPEKKDDTKEEAMAPREWPPVLPKEDRDKEEVVKVPWREEDDFIKPKDTPNPKKDPVVKKDKPEFDKPIRPTVPEEEKTFAKIVKKHSSLLITDPVGELALRRKGRKQFEQVTHPVEVNDGDMLVAKGASGFHIAGKHAVVLQPGTELSLSRVDDDSAAWFTVVSGKAIINSKGETWWFANGKGTFSVDKTDSMFSVLSKDDAMTVTPVGRELGCRNEDGETFAVKTGEAATLDGRGRRLGKVTRADRMNEFREFDVTRPSERTVLYTLFDFKKKDTDAVQVDKGLFDRERVGGVYNQFIAGTLTKKESIVELGFRTLELKIASPVTIRFRYRTNASKITVKAPITGKSAALVKEIEVSPKQRNRWQIAEVAFDLDDIVWISGGTLSATRHGYKSLEMHVSLEDVPGKGRPVVLIDDLQIVNSR